MLSEAGIAKVGEVQGKHIRSEVLKDCLWTIKNINEMWDRYILSPENFCFMFLLPMLQTIFTIIMMRMDTSPADEYARQSSLKLGWNID